ncbi:DUF5789 family protein [Haloplanus rubicundus]|nr:hypothetical protein [Haloplanus rubicundus]
MFDACVETPMRYSETHQLFDQACDFPTEHRTVVDRLGDVVLTTQSGDSVTVEEVLELTDETDYRSADDLYTSLLANLDDEFVGVKHYDDRSGSTPGEESVRGDPDRL